MSAGLIGALVGLAVALVSVAMLRALAARVELDETKRVLTITGVIELLLFPAAGWFVGTQVAGD
ncbi:MAG: hypothetical protein KF723_22625 [Rhizobiaceae bacterium]|nr:hypothetical protein [Rhizobiaceae bacterium]